MNNCQGFTVYLVEAICNQKHLTPDHGVRFLSHWLSLSKMQLSNKSMPPLSSGDADSSGSVNPNLSRLTGLTSSGTEDANRITADPTVSVRETPNNPSKFDPTTSKLKAKIPLFDEDCEVFTEADDNPQAGRSSPSQTSFEPWVFAEDPPVGKNDTKQKLDVWVIPFGQTTHGLGVGNCTLTLLLRYYHEEFVDFAWLQAMKRFALLLGLTNYSPDELLSCYHQALITWENNVDNDPGNPIMVTQLAKGYDTLGDLEREIAGWWRLFERHPTRLSFLRLLHNACVRKTSIDRGFASWVSFTGLCAMYLISRTAEVAGIGYLDWWPLAAEERFMIFEPERVRKRWITVT
jgi:hypothetical protein